MTRSRLAVLAIALTAGLAFAASAQAGDYIVVLKDGVSEPAVAADHARKGAEVSQHYQHALDGFAATLTGDRLSAIRRDPDVRFVVPDRPMELRPASNPRADPRSAAANPQALPIFVDRIDAELSSTRSGDGHGKVEVNVAVIDTGVDPDQPDLRVVGGKNCTGDPGGLEDAVGHGTAVAGVLAAKDNPTGTVGVAPGAALWSLRIVGASGLPRTSNLLCAIDFVTASRTDRRKNNDIAVANMSLRNPIGPRDDQDCGRSVGDALHLAICRSTAAGVTYVAAAQNDGSDFSAGTIPANYDEVLTATAMADFDGRPGGAADPVCEDRDFGEFGAADDVIASFSNFATLGGDFTHTLAAPGACASPTTAPLAFCSSADQRHPPHSCLSRAALSGTSFAAPAISGTVALCIHSGACAGLTPAQIRAKIVNDAAAYNQANPTYGFQGDPLRPIAGKHYGYLIRAGLYQRRHTRPGDTGRAMSQDDVEERVRPYFEAVSRGDVTGGVKWLFDTFNRRDLAAMMAVTLPEYEMHFRAELPDPGEAVFRGPEGVRQLWQRLDEDWEDLRLEVAEVVEAGECALVRYQQSARVPQSDTRVQGQNFLVIKFRDDGRPVESRVYSDGREAFEAVGLSE